MEDKKIRLALIGTNGIPANYGGAETLFENITRELSDRFDITVYCSKKQPRDKVGDSYLGAKLKYWPLSANGWQAIPYDTLSIFHAARHSDVLLIFGFTAAVVVMMMRFLGFKKKIIFNHGGLNEWDREKISKFNKWYSKWTRRSLRNKVEHIADNELYVKSLKEVCGIEKVYVIRYGGDQAQRVEPDAELLAKYPFLSEPYYVAVARAQVDNNLHILLEGFSKMPEKKLVLVSNFKVSEYGQKLYEQYKDKYPNMILIPGIYNKKELNAVRCNALAYIHSHSRCGTPPSLCEAMNLGLPIISYDMPVNHEVTQDNALFFKNADELVTAIKSSDEAKLKNMAEKSTILAKSDYTWKNISEQYSKVIS